MAFAIIDHTGARAMQPSRHSAGGSVRRQGWLSESGRDRNGVGVRNNVRARNAWRIFARRDGGRRVRGQRHFLADILFDFCSVTMSRAICSCTAASRSTMRRTTATSLATVSSWCCSSGDDPGATDTCAGGRKERCRLQKSCFLRRYKI